MIEGLLVVDKPAGPTSHDVVDQVRKLFSIRKVGHAGTLDPPATGILLVGLGRATRLLSFLQALPKSYRATCAFGVTTSTQDAEGEVLEERPCSFSKAELVEAATSFAGEIEQIPPMVSAVKVGGRPLYRAARRGESVERKPRRVRVYELEVEEFDPPVYRATIRVVASSGTYVRTLAADIGEKLGCGAHLESLRRLSVGSFSEKDAVSLDALSEASPEEKARHVLPMRSAMRDFPSLVVGGEESQAVSHGRPLIEEAAVRPGELRVASAPRAGQHPPHDAGMSAGIPVAVLDENGDLLAVYRRSRSGLKPAAVIAGS